ncbi:hypothetical protein [Roseibium sp.]|uniref:hypothetical protein n=1 Tax=Roseibium sp. TaxID=1936156 RepID=UPI003B52EF64
MTELEAYIQREEEELQRCLEQIDHIEHDRVPIPNDDDLKQIMLDHECQKRDMLQKHIATMKGRVQAQSRVYVGNN